MSILCRDIEDNQDTYDDIASIEKNGNNYSLFIGASLQLLLFLKLLFLWHIEVIKSSVKTYNFLVINMIIIIMIIKHFVRECSTFSNGKLTFHVFILCDFTESWSDSSQCMDGVRTENWNWNVTHWKGEMPPISSLQNQVVALVETYCTLT